MWPHRCPPEWGDRVRSCGTHGGTGSLFSGEAEVQSCGTHGGSEALLSTEAETRDAVQVVASEPSSAWRRGLELQDMWRYRSPPLQGGRVQSCGTHVSTGALLSWEVGSRAAGHVPVCGGTRSVGYQHPHPWLGWSSKIV
jgi:hypothetical protein